MKFISGLKNCHVPEVESLVVSERLSNEAGMIRVFYATYGHHLKSLYTDDTRKYFVVAPHNHRQDISITLLFGQVINWRVLPWQGSFVLTQYKFSSGILGRMDVTEMGINRVSMFPTELSTFKPLKLQATDVHTIQVISNEAAWLVDEGKLGTNPILAYNGPDWKPSAEGLYVTMTAQELESRNTQFTNYKVK